MLIREVEDLLINRMKESKTSFFGVPNLMTNQIVKGPIENTGQDKNRNMKSQEIDDQLEEILVNLRKEAEEKTLKVEMNGQEKKPEEKNQENNQTKNSVDHKELHSSNNNSKLHHLPNPKSLRSLLSPNSHLSADSNHSNQTSQLDHSVVMAVLRVVLGTNLEDLPDAKQRLEKTLARVKTDLARTDDVFTNKTHLLLHPTIRVPMMTLPNGDIPPAITAREMREEERKKLEEEKELKTKEMVENILIPENNIKKKMSIKK